MDWVSQNGRGNSPRKGERDSVCKEGKDFIIPLVISSDSLLFYFVSVCYYNAPLPLRPFSSNSMSRSYRESDDVSLSLTIKGTTTWVDMCRLAPQHNVMHVWTIVQHTRNRDRRRIYCVLSLCGVQGCVERNWN